METPQTTHTLLFLSGNGGLADSGGGQPWHVEDGMATRPKDFSGAGILISYAWTLKADKVRRRLDKFLRAYGRQS